VSQTAKPAPPPADRATLLRRAATATSAGRPAEAVAALREAANRFQSVQALLQLADIQSQGGDTRGAIESLRRAQALAPNAEAVLSTLARLSLADHASIPAVRALEPLARMLPEVAEYHRRLGEALVATGAYAAAESSLRRAESLEPNSVSTLTALGVALNRLDRCAEARPFLARCLELDPESVDAAAALAEAEARLGELDAAEARAQRALHRSTDHATASLALGIVYLKRERQEAARQALERAAAGAPESIEAHELLATVYEAMGDEARAETQRVLARTTRNEILTRVGQITDLTGVTAAGSAP
jgi:tetratricopeptide (TPR) repeat protein